MSALRRTGLGSDAPAAAAHHTGIRTRAGLLLAVNCTLLKTPPSKTFSERVSRRAGGIFLSVPAKKKSMPMDACQIKITLRGSKPPIWRRFVVPATIPLDILHHVIQVVMGWGNSHLHEFEIGGEEYTEHEREGIDLEAGGYDEREFRLYSVISGAKAKFTYLYDFGDSWDHTLLIEKLLTAESEPKPFVCVAGKGACPPEDCGGIWGYYNLLEVLGNPKHTDYAETKEWMGDEFDPNAFDLDAVNRSLAKLRRWVEKN